MRPPLLLATIVLCALSSVRCGGDQATVPQLTFVGTWNLKTVNDIPLPFLVQASGPKVEVMTDQFVINATGMFTEAYTLRLTDGTQVTTSSGGGTGTIERDGAKLTFSYPNGVLATGSITATTFTLLSQGFAQVFERGTP